jgi:hypothetical protein
MIDSSDHISGKTSLTVTLTISKNGGTFGAISGSIDELSNGWYKFTPAAGDFDTLGELAIHGAADGADPYDEKYTIVPVDPFDVNFGLSRLDAAVSSRSTFDGTSVGSVTNPVTVGTVNDKSGYSLSTPPPTAEEVRQEIDSNSTKLDVAVSTRSTFDGGAVDSVTNPVTVGTNNDKGGYSLSSNPPSVVQIRQEMDTNSTKLANLDATISSRSTYNGGPVESVTGSVKSVTDPVSVTIDPAVIAEGIDGVFDAPLAELSSIPPANGSLKQAIKFLFYYFRNKRTVTSTQETLYKDNGVTQLGVSTLSDSGTVLTKGKLG